MKNHKINSILVVFLTILAIFSSAVLLLLNPGYFWDDWLWINKDSEELKRAGLQMGVWWSGYLSAFLYGLKNHVLVLRLISLFCWIISALALSKIACKLKILTPLDSYFFFLIYVNCHFGLIRYFPSVAIYTAYIAAFWVAVLIFLYSDNNLFLRILSYILFIISFHLNSIIFIYLIFMMVLFFTKNKQTFLDFIKDKKYKNFNNIKLVFIFLLKQIWLDKKYLFYATAPIVFYFIIILPSQILISQLEGLNLYANYNKIKIGRLFTSIILSIKSGFTLVFDYLRIIKSKNTLLILFFSLFTYGIFFFLIVRKNIKLKCLSIKIYYQIFCGFFLVVISVFPYHLVNKPPLPFDLYESRHVLLAIPGIVILIVSFSNLFFKIFEKYNSKFGFYLKLLFLIIVISISTTNSLNFGLSLARDWLKQEDVQNYIYKHKNELSKYGVFIFNDKTSNLDIQNRYIFHYEYTGQILKTIGKQDHLGVSLSEYADSSINSPIFSNPEFKYFYNMKNLDIYKPFLILEITNSNVRLKTTEVLNILYDYWISNGREINDVGRLTIIKTATEFHEAENILIRINILKDAIEKYKASNGYYPSSFGVYQENPLISNLVSAKSFLNSSDVLEESLTPKYIDKGFFNQRCNHFRKNCNFLYLSDGVDYKLVYENPSDLYYAQQAYPSFVDSKGRYGVWTSNAKGW